MLTAYYNINPLTSKHHHEYFSFCSLYIAAGLMLGRREKTDQFCHWSSFRLNYNAHVCWKWRETLLSEAIVLHSLSTRWAIACIAIRFVFSQLRGESVREAGVVLGPGESFCATPTGLVCWSWIMIQWRKHWNHRWPKLQLWDDPLASWVMGIIYDRFKELKNTSNSQ